MRRVINGPISQHGSNTTRGPFQCQILVTALVLLSDPGPANTMECPGPRSHHQTADVGGRLRPIRANQAPWPAKPPDKTCSRVAHAACP